MTIINHPTKGLLFAGEEKLCRKLKELVAKEDIDKELMEESMRSGNNLNHSCTRHPSPNVSSQSRILAPKWVTHHFWEIHICGAAPLSINAILPICEGLVAARMTLCAVVNTSHPHIPETHQESRMKAFVG